MKGAVARQGFELSSLGGRFTVIAFFGIGMVTGGPRPYSRTKWRSGYARRDSLLPDHERLVGLRNLVREQELYILWLTAMTADVML